MRTHDAVDIIRNGIQPRGYHVAFEWKNGRILSGDHFPDFDEPLIPTAEAAWVLAKQFAANTRGKAINIYVVDDKFFPVKDYKKRKIENR